jgi:hypothetical protein
MRDQFKEKKKLYTIIERATGGRCSYDAAKAVVLARSYGQQLKSMAAGLNISLDEGQKVSYEVEKDRRTGKESAGQLKAAEESSRIIWRQIRKGRCSASALFRCATGCIRAAHFPLRAAAARRTAQ